jgi:subtilisin family serine protease
LLLVGLALSLAACTLSPDTTELDSSSYLLTLKLGPSDTQAALAARYGGKLLAWNPEVGQAIVEVSRGQTRRLLDTDAVSQGAVSSNALTSAPEFSASGWQSWAGGWSVWGGGSSIPAPPQANKPSWNQIGLSSAHQISRRFGEGVKVAVIDTGLDLNHPAFNGHLAPAWQWKDFVDGDMVPQDEPGVAYGHGTGVAALILQVAPRATILPIRVLGRNGLAWESNVIRAIKWATDQGAQVINLSFGSDKPNLAVTSQLRASIAAGSRIVASAGNNGRENGVEFPAHLTWEQENYARIMGIGSVDPNDVVSLFSTYGFGTFGFAPGEDLYSAYPGNQVAFYNGTSFAAPLFAGAVALAYSEMPNAADRDKLHDLVWDSMDEEVSAVNQSARGIDFAPRLNVEKLIRSLPGWTPPSPPNTFN